MTDRFGGQDPDTHSRAAILRHPLHPMLVPFPIAFLSGVLLTDLAFTTTGRPFWAEASYWLLVGGIVGAVLAALPGSWDLLAIRRARRLPSAHVHAFGNVVVLALAALSLWLRWDDPAGAIGNWGLPLSILILVLLGATGWIGGELSYRHQIGVDEDGPAVAEANAGARVPGRRGAGVSAR